VEAAAPRTDEELARKARVVFLLRFLVALACAVALAVFESGDVFSSPRFRYAYILLLCVCILDLAYVPLLRHLGLKAGQVVLHLVIDIAAISTLAYLTGGYLSAFVFLYFGSVLAAGYLLAPIPAYAISALAVAGLGGVSLIFHTAHSGFALPLIPSPMAEPFIKAHEELSSLIGNLFLQALAFFTVSFLGSRLLRRASEERIVIEEIIESMGDGVITVDRHGNVAVMNHSVRSIFEVDPSVPVVGRSLQEILAVHGDLGRRLVQGRQEQFETLIARRDRRPLAAVISTWPIGEDLRRPRGTVAIVKDLTLEKEVEEVRKTAERLKGIREMAAGIAHEIRNPLASIRGSIQELTTSAVVSPEDRQLMSIILKESDRLNDIITEFLELTAKRGLMPRKVFITDLVSDVVQLLSRRLELGESNIRNEVTEPMEVSVDVNQIKVVFFNIGLNALQAMRKPGLLHIKAHAQESYLSTGVDRSQRTRVPGVSIAFLDTGPGIDSETLPKIFMPFFSTRPRGTGIGLSLAQRTVDAHGGILSVDSTPGTGTTFTVWIPRDIETAESGKPQGKT